MTIATEESNGAVRGPRPRPQSAENSNDDTDDGKDVVPTRPYGQGPYRLFAVRQDPRRMTTTELNSTDPTSTDRTDDDHRQIAEQCDITHCVRAADQVIEHLQRGQLAACSVHTARIRAPDDTRFRGGALR